MESIKVVPAVSAMKKSAKKAPRGLRHQRVHVYLIKINKRLEASHSLAEKGSESRLCFAQCHLKIEEHVQKRMLKEKADERARRRMA